MARTTEYRGAFGYNESPTELGGTDGFWVFPDYEALAYAYASSSSLDEVFQQLDVPTYSKVITATDTEGYALFHLLVISVRDDLYMRQYDLVELAGAWLKIQGHVDLNIKELGVAGVTREMLEKMKREHEVHLERLSTVEKKQQAYIRELRFIYGHDTEEQYAASAPPDPEEEDL